MTYIETIEKQIARLTNEIEAVNQTLLIDPDDARAKVRLIKLKELLQENQSDLSKFTQSGFKPTSTTVSEHRSLSEPVNQPIVEEPKIEKPIKKVEVMAESSKGNKLRNGMIILSVSVLVLFAISAFFKWPFELNYKDKEKEATLKAGGKSNIVPSVDSIATVKFKNIIGSIKINGSNKIPLRISGIKVSNITIVPSVQILGSNKFLFENVDITDVRFLIIEIDFANGSFSKSDPLQIVDKTKPDIDLKELLFEVTEEKDKQSRPIVIFKKQNNFVGSMDGNSSIKQN